MSLTTFWNKKIKKMDWQDIGLIKLSVAAFALMLAKLWNPILNLNWYWYLIILIVAGIRPMYRTYFK